MEYALAGQQEVVQPLDYALLGQRLARRRMHEPLKRAVAAVQIALVSARRDDVYDRQSAAVFGIALLRYAQHVGGKGLFGGLIRAVLLLTLPPEVQSSPPSMPACSTLVPAGRFMVLS